LAAADQFQPLSPQPTSHFATPPDGDAGPQTYFVFEAKLFHFSPASNLRHLGFQFVVLFPQFGCLS
jgi:hypothetical protein